MIKLLISCLKLYTTQVNGAFCACVLARSEVISQLLFTSEPPCVSVLWHPSCGLIYHSLTLALSTGLVHGTQLFGPRQHLLPLPFSHINMQCPFYCAWHYHQYFQDLALLCYHVGSVIDHKDVKMWYEHQWHTRLLRCVQCFCTFWHHLSPITEQIKVNMESICLM